MANRRSLRQRRQQRVRRNRLYIIGGVIVIALVFVGILVLGNRPQPVGDYTTITKQAWPSADGKALGPANASVVVQVFSDFQCPYCRQYAENVEPQVIKDYVDAGKIRYEYHHFIVIDQNVGGTESRHAAQASECASQQGDFWDYHAMLFANQQSEGSGTFSDDRLKAFAQTLGYDMNQFNSCLTSTQAADAVKADEAIAAADKLNSTPSLLVNGTLIQNPLNYSTIQAAIDGALNSSK